MLVFLVVVVVMAATAASTPLRLPPPPQVGKSQRQRLLQRRWWSLLPPVFCQSATTLRISMCLTLLSSFLLHYPLAISVTRNSKFNQPQNKVVANQLRGAAASPNYASRFVATDKTSTVSKQASFVQAKKSTSTTITM